MCSTMCLLVKMLKFYGKLLVRTMNAQKMLQMKDIMFSFYKLNSFKQLDHENAETMYSRLNILVNEINSFGVKRIDDAELIRKILHSYEGRTMIW